MQKMSKEKAIQLRKQGFSYSEISGRLGTPKSTLSYWLKNVKVSKNKIAKLERRSSRAGRQALLEWSKSQTILAKKKAEETFNKESQKIEGMSKKDLLVAGAMLYLGEGGKSGGRVDITNSNIDIIRIAMRFFREVCEVSNDKFRAQLNIHKNVSKDVAIRYWSKVTNIPEKQFIKISTSQSILSKNKRRKNKLPYGTIQIRISDVNLYHRIRGWIYGIIEQLDNMPG